MAEPDIPTTDPTQEDKRVKSGIRATLRKYAHKAIKYVKEQGPQYAARKAATTALEAGVETVVGTVAVPFSVAESIVRPQATSTYGLPVNPVTTEQEAAIIKRGVISQTELDEIRRRRSLSASLPADSPVRQWLRRYPQAFDPKQPLPSEAEAQAWLQQNPTTTQKALAYLGKAGELAEPDAPGQPRTINVATQPDMPALTSPDAVPARHKFFSPTARAAATQPAVPVPVAANQNTPASPHAAPHDQDLNHFNLGMLT